MNLEFLKDLVNTYSPSGCEDELQKKIYKNYKKDAQEFITDNRGTLTTIYNKDSDFKVMIIAHADEIGLVVNGYNSDGTLKVTKNGGIRPNLYVGQRVVVLTEEKQYFGIMGVNSQMGHKADLTVDDLFIDLGFKSKSEALLKVKVGSHCIHQASYMEMENGYICARAFDDRLGCFISHEAALKASKLTKNGIYVTTSTGEETTGRGAYSASMNVKPDVCIVVDVTYSNDYMGANCENDVILGNGGVVTEGSVPNRKLNKLLASCAKELNLPIQYEVWQGRTGTDGDTILKTNVDIPIVLYSIPLRYMHSPVEVACKDDVSNMIDVLASFIVKLNKKMSFKPFEVQNEE